jgi:hypothetical protein
MHACRPLCRAPRRDTPQGAVWQPQGLCALTQAVQDLRRPRLGRVAADLLHPLVHLVEARAGRVCVEVVVAVWRLPVRLGRRGRLAATAAVGGARPVWDRGAACQVELPCRCRPPLHDAQV